MFHPLGRRTVRVVTRCWVRPDRSARCPALSLEPEFRRSHGSLYKALARGGSTRSASAAARRAPAEVLAPRLRRRRLDLGSLRCRVQPRTGLLLLGLQTSAGQPIVAGGPTSGSASSTGRPIAGPRRSMLRITPQRTPRPRRSTSSAAWSGSFRRSRGAAVRLDAGYDPIAIGHGLGDARCEVLPHPRRPGLLFRSSGSPEPTTRDRRAAATPWQALQVLGSEDLARSRRPASSPPTLATARSTSRPGMACTRGSLDAAAGPATAYRRS